MKSKLSPTSLPKLSDLQPLPPSPSRMTIPPSLPSISPFPSLQPLADALPPLTPSSSLQPLPPITPSPSMHPLPAINPSPSSLKIPSLPPINIPSTSLKTSTNTKNIEETPTPNVLPVINIPSTSLNIKTKTKRQTKEQTKEERTETFFTLDNGEDRFRVELDRNTNSIVVSENKPGKKKFIIYENQNAKRIFDGSDDNKNKQDKGSSFLVEEKDGSYVYIGEIVKKFKTLSPIVSYSSPIGNSGVPYPYAIDKDNRYYLLIYDIITNGPYSSYFQSFFITPEVASGRQPTFDYGIKELWDQKPGEAPEQYTFTFQTRLRRLNNPYIITTNGEKIPLTYQKFREIREKAAENIGVVGFLRPFVIYDKADQYHEEEDAKKYGEFHIDPVSVEEEDDYINNKLRLAALKNNVREIERLEKEHAPYGQGLDWDWGLSGAVEGNHFNLVEYFVSKGAKDWDSGLANAARTGNQKMIDYFIKKGAKDWDYAMASAAAGGQEKYVNFFRQNYNAQNLSRAANAATRQNRQKLATYILSL